MILLKILRIWPFQRGRDFIYRNISEQVKLAMDVLNSEVCLKSGTKIYVRKKDYLSRWYRCYGEYEAETMRIMRKYAREDEIFLDIGANLGVFSLEIARTEKCNIIAFEPNPPTAECFKKSIKANKLTDRIKLFQVALSSESCKVNLIDSPINAGASALETSASMNNIGDRYEVRAESLDDFSDFKLLLAELNKKIGLIKMDIEGAEMLALEGMSNVLKKHKPVLIIELIDSQLRSFGSSKKELVKLLNSYDFKLSNEFEGNGLFIHSSRNT